MRNFYETAHVRSIEVRGNVSSLDIHRHCDGHVLARLDDASVARSHAVFRACPQVALGLPKWKDSYVPAAATVKLAPGIDAWYDDLLQLNLSATGLVGMAVLETLVCKRALEHALYPERLYAHAVQGPVCFYARLGLVDVYTRVKNMIGITDVRNGYPRSSSVNGDQMLISAS